MASLSHAADRLLASLWLCLVCLGACKVGGPAPPSTGGQLAPAPAAPLPDAAAAPSSDGALAEYQPAWGRLLAEIGQDRFVDMARARDALFVLIKEREGPKATVLRVHTDRVVAAPKVVGGCPHGADRIAVDANYLYLPCLGSLPPDSTPGWNDAPRNPDGEVWAVPLDGDSPRLLAQHARRPFWIGADSPFVYWFDRVILYRAARPEPGAGPRGTPPERIAQHGADGTVFLGSDGAYFQHGRDIIRATTGHVDRWRIPNLTKLLGLGPSNVPLVALDRQPNDVFRFAPDSGALVPVAQIDQPVAGILWLPNDSMLVRSTEIIWRTTFSGASPIGTTRWRRLPRTIVGWAADDRTLYLALEGSSLEPTRGFRLVALPLEDGSPTRSQSAPAPVPLTLDPAPTLAPDAPMRAECRSLSGELVAELAQTQLLDMVAMGDRLFLLIKEDKRRAASVLRLRTDRAWTQPTTIQQCSAGAARIAADDNYVYVPCLGSLPAQQPPSSAEPLYGGDGFVTAVPLDGGHPRRFVQQARDVTWIGVDSSFFYWFGRDTLYRLAKPRPGPWRGPVKPDVVASLAASPRMFLGSDGVYLAKPGTILRAGLGRRDEWKLPNLAALLGLGVRDEILVQLEGERKSVFRFSPDVGAPVRVARVDQPVVDILPLADGSVLVRAVDTIWRTTIAGGSPSDTTRWRRLSRTIVGWAANEHTLYLALEGSPLDPTRGFGLYALPLRCGPTVEPVGGRR